MHKDLFESITEEGLRI